eukprot:3765260-Pyramimonas_sp.AAC.1
MEAMAFDRTDEGERDLRGARTGWAIEFRVIFGGRGGARSAGALLPRSAAAGGKAERPGGDGGAREDRRRRG